MLKQVWIVKGAVTDTDAYIDKYPDVKLGDTE